MIAFARLLTLVFVGAVAGLTVFAVIDRVNAAGTPAVTLIPAAPDANWAFVVTAVPAGSALRLADHVELRDPELLAALQFHSLRVGSTIAFERTGSGRPSLVSVPVRRAGTTSFAFIFIPIVAMFWASHLSSRSAEGRAARFPSRGSSRSSSCCSIRRRPRGHRRSSCSTLR